MRKPWFVKLSEKQWDQTVEYFNRKKRRLSADQRSRIIVNKRRKARQGPMERGVYHAPGIKAVPSYHI